MFRGGFTREVAKAVADANLRQLARLASKSLLQGGGGKDGRYQVHELLRQYGAEKLKESGEETAVYDQYAAYYCGLLHDLWPRLQGREHKITLAKIEADAQNVQATWEWSVAQKRGDLLAQARDSLGHFYESHGHYEAG